jgi:hypothetical protein
MPYFLNEKQVHYRAEHMTGGPAVLSYRSLGQTITGQQERTARKGFPVLSSGPLSTKIFQRLNRALDPTLQIWASKMLRET